MAVPEASARRLIVVDHFYVAGGVVFVRTTEDELYAVPPSELLRGPVDMAAPGCPRIAWVRDKSKQEVTQ